MVRLINECRKKAIPILPPDVNASDRDFAVVGDSIRFGMAAVKNVGEAAVEAILKSRDEQGAFRSLFDFCQRVDLQRVNRRVLDQLVKCGAFDSIHPSRARVLAALDSALDAAQIMQRDRQSGQINIFALLKSQKKRTAEPELPEAPDWDARTTIQFEKETLGFYISGHPLDFYADQVAAICSADTQSVKEKREGTEVTLCGMLGITKELTTRKGDRMAFLALEDKEGILEIVSFSETFLHAQPLLARDEPLVVIGKVQHDEKGSKVLAERIVTLDEARVQTVDAVRIHLPAERLDRDGLTRLRHLLLNHPGDCKTLSAPDGRRQRGSGHCPQLEAAGEADPLLL